MKKKFICGICNNSQANEIYEFKEMMYGLRDKFIYFQCSNCECLQINEVPENISKYYPENYYSYLTSEIVSRNPLRKILINLRDSYAVLNKGYIGKYIFKIFPNDSLQILSHLKLKKNSYILDVGCGIGVLLNNLGAIGLENVFGIDPYIKDDIEYKNGIKIFKKSIYEMNGKWDVIMFNHSLEHIQDQLETLQSATKLLNTEGTCLIRVPTVNSYAWKHFRENWVQIDAPRHFFIHSYKSISILAEKAELRIDKVVYDSFELQFWGSEQYLRDIPLLDSRSYNENPGNSIFTKSDIDEYKRKSKELNMKNLGDACAFFLKKK